MGFTLAFKVCRLSQELLAILSQCLEVYPADCYWPEPRIAGLVPKILGIVRGSAHNELPRDCLSGASIRSPSRVVCAGDAGLNVFNFALGLAGKFGMLDEPLAARLFNRFLWTGAQWKAVAEVFLPCEHL